MNDQQTSLYLIGWKHVSPFQYGYGTFLFIVPVEVPAYSIAMYWVFPESAQPANKLMCLESQFNASPGCKSFFVMLWDTVCIVKVVKPGRANSQHIDTKPEQSVR